MHFKSAHPSSALMSGNSMSSNSKKRAAIHHVDRLGNYNGDSAIKRSKTEHISKHVLALMMPDDITSPQKQAAFNRINASQALLNHYSVDEEFVDDGYTAIHSKTSVGSKFTSSLSISGASLVVHETSKEKGDELFASDAILKQLAILSGKDSSCIPSKLPSEIVRDTISNDKTKTVIRSIANSLRSGDSFTIEFNRKEPDALANQYLLRLLQTPNGKMTTNMIKDFNLLSGTKYCIKKAEVEGLDSPDITFSLAQMN